MAVVMLDHLCRISVCVAAIGCALPAATLDLSKTVVVVRPGPRPEPERTAATVLVEELEKRTGIRLPVVADLPASGAAIVMGGGAVPAAWTQRVPPGNTAPPAAEGYRLTVEERAGAATVWILGADPRGLLFGAGALLRHAAAANGRLEIDTPFDLTTSPAYPIRGHQLGYRAAANSWDAWSVAQFEQYIRELALFGANSIENIPFQDRRSSPLMKVPRREMNRAMSEICRRYGLDYWVWTPADFDLNDAPKRTAALAQFDELFSDCVELTGIFVPGGDPGDNPPDLVFSFMEEVARRMKPRHPKARLWLSLQGFDKQKEEQAYRLVEQKMPEWLGGFVAGPSSPPVARTRQRLPKRYGVRLYPDLTHNKICQYQVPSWDQAFALTLGREAINPRPAEFAAIHNRYAAYSVGFLSYSDGVHDDVNKAVWSAMAWNPATPVRDVLVQYSRLFFGPGVATRAADGILALERNWRGPVAENGGVDGTLLFWQALERDASALASNWRWQMCLLRAVYDAYVRHRSIYETQLEQQANRALADPALESGPAMQLATGILQRAITSPVRPELRTRIFELCEQLFASIGLQTSVEKYNASGTERGAVLDFVDTPLNNRWWLEDEFRKVAAIGTEPARRARLMELARWEDPGPGGYYDDIGHEARSPRVDGDAEQDPDSFRGAEPTFWWWDNGRSRARLSAQTTMWPRRMVYEGLNPEAVYAVQTSGYGKSLLRVNGQRVSPSAETNGRTEFILPAGAAKDRRLVLTWDIPDDEGSLNWRQRSRLAEVWLVRRR